MNQLDWMGPRLTSWLNGQRSRLNKEYDLLLPITGAEGNGKSTLAAYLATALDSTFGPDRLTYSAHDFMELSLSLPPGRSVIMDEGDEGAFSRESMTTENRDLAKHLFRSRVLGQPRFILLPNMRWLDTVISEHRATYWILVEKRGKALLHELRRADYPGAKASWTQLFHFDFPAPDFPWWPEYVAAKERRLKSPKPTSPKAVQQVLPEMPSDDLAAQFRRVQSTR